MTDPAVTRYRKRPVEVDALEWTGENEQQLVEFTGGRFRAVPAGARVDDPTITGEVYDDLHATWVGLRTGHRVIRGVRGEFYPIAPDVLAETYEPATEPMVQIHIEPDPPYVADAIRDIRRHGGPPRRR